MLFISCHICIDAEMGDSGGRPGTRGQRTRLQLSINILNIIFVFSSSSMSIFSPYAIM